MAATDQEGIYEGLLWTVRALEECGRAFTRLASRLGKVEARLTALEAASTGGSATANELGVRLNGLAERLSRLEREREQRLAADAKPAGSITPAAIVEAPTRADPQIATLRRELAAAQFRISKLEGAERRAATPSVPDDVVARAVAPLSAQVAGLEGDVQGVYRELDGVAELVADRFAALGRDLARLANVERRAPAPAEAAASTVAALESRLRAIEARLDRAESPSSEVERLYHALEQLVGKGPSSGSNGRAAAPSPATAPRVATGPSRTPPADWQRNDLRRPSLELTPESVRQKATSVLNAELARIRHTLDVLTGEEPGRPSTSHPGE